MKPVDGYDTTRVNRDLLQYIIEHCENDLQVAFVMYRDVQHKWPQLNPASRISHVESPTVRIEQIADGVEWFQLRPRWYPAKGFKAWVARRIKHIHKWLIDNRYHPADRPVGWKPLDVSAVGMIDIQAAQVPNYGVRTIYPERYGAVVPWFRDNFPLSRRTYYIACGYDALTDTMFIWDY